MKIIIVILFTIIPFMGAAQINVMQLSNGKYMAVGKNISIGKGSIAGTNFKTGSSQLHFGKNNDEKITLYVNFYSVAQLNIPEGAVIKITYNNKETKKIVTKKLARAQYDESRYYYSCNFWVGLTDEDLKTIMAVGINRLEMSYSKIHIIWNLKNKYSAVIKSAKEIVAYKF